VERFSAVLAGNGFPVSLGDQLSMVGINGFLGESNLSFNMSGRTDGGFSLGGNVNIIESRLLDPRGTLAEAVDTAIREADYVNLGIQYIHHTTQNDEFNITTNIADLIYQALRRTAEIYARRALEEIETALRQKINEYIDGRFISRDQLDGLLAMARGDRTAIEQTRTALNTKLEELQHRVTAQAEQAIRDNLPGNLPGGNLLPGNLPVVPGLPGRH
jgi:hypothetical protein